MQRILRESNTIELKSQVPAYLEKEVVAFLNSALGGDIYVGVNDDGSVASVENLDATMLTIAQRIKDNILPTCLGLVVNAIVHNDYSSEVPPVVEMYADRVSITSYGGLVQGLDIKEFFEGRSMPRNRELMRIFKDLDMVEQLGSGMSRILSVYDTTVFKVSQNFLEVCFPFADGYAESLGLQKSSEKIISLIAEEPQITAIQLAKQIGLTSRAVEKHLKKLKESGKIERVGGRKEGYWHII